MTRAGLLWLCLLAASATAQAETQKPSDKSRTTAGAAKPAPKLPPRPAPSRTVDDPLSVGVQWRASNAGPYGRNSNDSTINTIRRDLPGAKSEADSRFGLGLNFKY